MNTRTGQLHSAVPASAAALPAAPTLLGSRLLQRQCACGAAGGAGGECESCRKKRLLQRRPAASAAPAANTGVPASVQDVLASPGRPLAAADRSFFEGRLGHDFSQVRIHDDAPAAQSASAVGALAYTVGQRIAFGTGQFQPGTAAGRHLLAHELVHTLQQRGVGDGPASGVGGTGTTEEHEAERIAHDALHGTGAMPVTGIASSGRVLRRTPISHCTAGTNGAPADPERQLQAAELFAQLFAVLSSTAAGSEANTIRLNRALNPGQPALPTSAWFTAFQNRFGLAPASGTKFRNRVTGGLFNNQEEAVASELDTLAHRLEQISDRLDGNMHYFCINGSVTRMGCTTDCVNADASTCAGIRAIFLCPGFWALSTQGQGTLLIHELAHQVFSTVSHTRNFRHASCYANFAADVHSAPTTNPECVP